LPLLLPRRQFLERMLPLEVCTGREALPLEEVRAELGHHLGQRPKDTGAR